MTNADTLAALRDKLNNPKPSASPIFDQLFDEYIDELDYMDYQWANDLYDMNEATR